MAFFLQCGDAPQAACETPPLPASPFEEVDHFLGRYAPSGRGRSDRPPDLADSLAALLRDPDAASLLASLPAGPECLIEGCAGPENADALRSLLGRLGATRARILAVDLIDLPEAYQRCGYAWPDMRFVRADACDLGLVAPAATFDLLVQDFLLNCLPPVHAPRLLAEAARVLHPGGLALVSFTDDRGARARRALSTERLSDRHGLRWDPSATSLADLEPDPARLAGLLGELGGAVIESPGIEARTLVTAPHGRFEFFVPAERTREQFARAGLDLLVERIDQGRDDHGLDCTRHRCLARRVAP